MTRGKKRLLIVLCVLVGLVVVLSIAVRLVLTKERLLALIVPRIEERVQASITIEDIGVRFPFGFGVDVKGLEFAKPLADKGNMTFSSERIIVKASLMSLIRRSPEINKVDVKGGTLVFSMMPSEMKVSVGGLGAAMSMEPADTSFRFEASVDAREVTIAAGGNEQAVTLEDLSFDGDVESDGAFSTFTLHKGRFEWGDFFATAISGEFQKPEAGGRFSVIFESEECSIAPLLERVLSFKLEELFPPKEGKPKPLKLPVDIVGGTFRFDATAAGRMDEPDRTAISGKAAFSGVKARHEALPVPLEIAGDISLSQESVGSDEITIGVGKSRAVCGLDISLAAGRKPEKVNFAGQADIDVADLVTSLEIEGLSASGRVKADIGGGGTPDVLAGLFPANAQEATPEQIGRFWKMITLSGSVKVEDVAARTAESAAAVSGLTGTARIEQGDINDLQARFELGGSPYEVQGTFKGLMPALAELMLMVKQEREIASLRDLLYSIQNVPDIALALEGRSFDSRRFQKKEKGGEIRGKGGATGGGADNPASGPAAQNPIVPLILKNSTFTAQLDSVITDKAVFTAVAAKGKIRDGIVKADPVTLEYAGGKGKASLDVDMRDPSSVKTHMDLSLDNVEAARALESISRYAGLLNGRFTISSKGSLTNEAGKNPLMSLTATGSAFSSSGKVDFQPFLAPLSASGQLPLDNLKSFDFREWSGHFIIEQGRLKTDDWKIISPIGDWSISGFFGLDGMIGYDVQLVIPPNVQKNMKDLRKYGDLVDLLRDEKGNLILDIRVSGSADDPKASLDMTRATEKAGDKLMDQLKKKASDYLKK
jgi:hypothetical protein